jgi:phosphohistidine phosphatase SixA
MLRVWSALTCGVIVVGLIGLRQHPATAQDQKPDGVTVWLVRHAEKAKLPKGDPVLLPKGTQRAKRLADLLGDKGVTLIITSNAQRTIDTAAPLVERLKGKATVLKRDSVDEVVNEIKKAQGKALVVHHSNTVPAVINAMRGSGVAPLPEIKDGVFNRVFILELEGVEVACRQTTYEDWVAKKNEKAC